MGYLFVHRNGGWWLKIRTAQELIDYHEKTGSRWAKAFDSLVNSKEFTRTGMSHASRLAYAIGQYGARNKMNSISAVIGFQNGIFDDQLALIAGGSVLFVNKDGGYWYEKAGQPESQFIHKEELIFPNFSKDEIRVERFPGGTHFYAYIGDMQVRDGDTLKWDTYSEAMARAKEVAGPSNKEGV